VLPDFLKAMKTIWHKDIPCYWAVMRVKSAQLIAIVICLPTFLIRNLRRKIPLI